MQQLDIMERNVEAILFASGEAIEFDKIGEVLNLDVRTVKLMVERIRERYNSQNSALDIAILGASCQMCTLPQYAGVIRPALELRRGAALSPAALEVLAVIAYNQPVTRSFIEQVRGVECSQIVRGLMDKDLIEEAGRLNIPGKPIAYRTTVNFLRAFGLESLEQLPTLPDLPPEEEEVLAIPDEHQVEGQIDLFDL